MRSSGSSAGTRGTPAASTSCSCSVRLHRTRSPHAHAHMHATPSQARPGQVMDGGECSRIRCQRLNYRFIPTIAKLEVLAALRRLVNNVQSRKISRVAVAFFIYLFIFVILRLVLHFTFAPILLPTPLTLVYNSQLIRKQKNARINK